MRKFWPAALISAVLFLVVIVIPIWSSTDFRYCENDNGQYPAANTTNNNAPTVRTINTKPSWIFGSCLSGFVNANGVGITALATILLTLVTGILGYIAYAQYTTTRRQLRAYIFVDVVFLQDGPSPPLSANPAASGCPHGYLEIKNMGITPAYKVRHGSKIEFCPIGPDTKIPTSAINPFGDIETLAPTTIGPGSKTTMSPHLGRSLTANEVQALAGNGFALVVHGKITYEDVFGTPHRTNYRLGYAGVWPPVIPHNPTFLSEGNEAN